MEAGRGPRQFRPPSTATAAAASSASRRCAARRRRVTGRPASPEMMAEVRTRSFPEASVPSVESHAARSIPFRRGFSSDAEAGKRGMIIAGGCGRFVGYKCFGCQRGRYTGASEKFVKYYRSLYHGEWIS
uniref:Uncharacterized protein n=1 Tax=Oryza meridionalis TaxID=40149 RepID=A0A0E0CNA5_9ORYZ